MNILTQAAIGIGLLIAAFFTGEWKGHHNATLAQEHASDKIVIQNVKDVDRAEVKQSEEVRTIIKYVHDRPSEPIRVCISPVQSAGSTADGTSAAPALGDGLLNGDSGLQPVQAGRDIQDLLYAHAAVLDAQIAALRAEQAVGSTHEFQGMEARPIGYDPDTLLSLGSAVDSVGYQVDLDAL